MSRWSRARAAQSHRTWPAPDAPWVGRMAWTDLLFLHWPVDAEAVAPHVPPGVSLDVADGRAWITLTCHMLRRMGPRLTPPLPPFAELNVRTYVAESGKPGVLFLSIHAPNPLVVAAGRAIGIPYHLGRTVMKRDGGRRRFASRAGTQRFAASYVPRHGEVEEPIDRWLAERYCMYSHVRGRWLRTEVHHPPWPLQPVEVEANHQGLLERFGVTGPPLRTAFAQGVDVVMWPPERVPERPDAPPITRESMRITHL